MTEHRSQVQVEVALVGGGTLRIASARSLYLGRGGSGRDSAVSCEERCLRHPVQSEPGRKNSSSLNSL